MKDPGPNPVELLAAILAKTGVAVPPSPGAFPANPTLWPALFYWKGDLQHHMVEAGDGDYSIGIEDDEGHALCGHRNIRMTTRQTDPTATDDVFLTKSLPFPPSGFVRLQLALSCPYTNTGRQYEFWLDHYADPGVYQARWMLQTGAPFDPFCSYVNSAGTWTTIPGWDWLGKDFHWNTIDICVNLLDHKQQYIRVNHQITDLANEAIYAMGSAEKEHLEFSIHLDNVSAECHTVYLDHILLTAEKIEVS